jgi:hypothetical protein
MNFSRSSLLLQAAWVLMCLATAGTSSVLAQVSPAEIINPHLKALEQEYFPHLVALNRQISAEHHPFPFVLSRYIGADPKDQRGMDTRGLEFIYFHERALLKFSGDYNAAFSTLALTRNQRAAQVFTDIVAPVLRLLPQHFTSHSNFDGFGFEISYHVRAGQGKGSYEGRENLVVVMPVEDALQFSQAADRNAQQSLLNRSEVYISGERYGLALGQADPLSLEEIADSLPTGKREQNSEASEKQSSTSNSSASGFNSHPAPASTNHSATTDLGTQKPTSAGSSPLTAVQVDEMQARYRSPLDQYGTAVRAFMGQTSSVAPSLALFRNSLYLQFTLRNPQIFDKDKTSLYKRAALSFDTFLAPHLSDLVSRVPTISGLKGLDITILVSTSANGPSSEAVEFVCPLTALRRFVAYEISNQDLIEESLVIVNGVRISLNLQQVE